MKNIVLLPCVFGTTLCQKMYSHSELTIGRAIFHWRCRVNKSTLNEKVKVETETDI